MLQQHCNAIYQKKATTIYKCEQFHIKNAEHLRSKCEKTSKDRLHKKEATTCKHKHGGRFAGAVMTKKCCDLAFVHVQIQFVDGRHRLSWKYLQHAICPLCPAIYRNHPRGH